MQILRSRVEEKVKKVFVIKGSSRESGFTNTLIGEALGEIKDAEISVFDAYKNKTQPCVNCGFCLKNEKCIYDDLADFFKDFENADVIIFASPVFNGGFSSPLKAVIDRFQIYFNLFYKNGKSQPIKKRRKAILLCAAGRVARAEHSFMEASLKRAFTVLNIELSGSVLLEKTDELTDFPKEKDDFIALLKRSLKDD